MNETFILNGQFLIKFLGNKMSIEYLIKIKPNQRRFKIVKRLNIKSDYKLDEIKKQIILNSLNASFLSHYYAFEELLNVFKNDIKCVEKLIKNL